MEREVKFKVWKALEVKAVCTCLDKQPISAYFWEKKILLMIFSLCVGCSRVHTTYVLAEK